MGTCVFSSGHEVQVPTENGMEKQWRRDVITDLQHT